MEELIAIPIEEYEHLKKCREELLERCAKMQLQALASVRNNSQIQTVRNSMPEKINIEQVVKNAFKDISIVTI